MVSCEYEKYIINPSYNSFGVCESDSLAWVVCDKIIKEFARNEVPLDLQQMEGEDDDEEEFDGIPGECPICNRQMPLTFHHLIPKSTHKKMIKLYSKEHLCSRGIDICRPCHSHIHRLIPLMDMAEHYNTLESILSHKGVKKWIPYIRKQKMTSKSDKRVAVQTRNLNLPEECDDDD